MSRAAYYRQKRLEWLSLGMCGNCGGRPVVEGFRRCSVCRIQSAEVNARRVADGRNCLDMQKRRRRPNGWARDVAGDHRRRVRSHNTKYPDHPLLEKIIDGPSLLAAIVAHGPTCGLCGIHTGFPWEHVGKETGPEVDHILSMWAIINEGRQDWASVSNIRLLCVGCHSSEGIRLKRQDIEERAHMDRMLGKDNT